MRDRGCVSEVMWNYSLGTDTLSNTLSHHTTSDDQIWWCCPH